MQEQKKGQQRMEAAGRRKGGVVVDFAYEFKISDLSAPCRAVLDPSKRGKKISSYHLSANAPTRLNLPHNSFVRPQKAKAEDGGKAEMYKELRAASKAGDDKAIRRLVEGGADVNCPTLDSYGFTPLHYAAWKGRTEAVGVLLKLGANVDPLNRDHKTPLHLAASNGKASTVRALVRGGASLTKQDKDGNTPLDLALTWCNNETVPALKQCVLERDMEREGRKQREKRTDDSKTKTVSKPISGAVWKADKANELAYPQRVASNKNHGPEDFWGKFGDYAHVDDHHISVNRVGVYPCSEAWR